jgi:hypothetical protein
MRGGVVRRATSTLLNAVGSGGQYRVQIGASVVGVDNLLGGTD